MILLKSGVSVLKMLVQTWLLILQRESNTWTKLKNQWFLLSNGPLNKEFFVNKIWEVWDSTFLIVNFTLMLFTEVEDKSCQLPEDFIMLLNYFLVQLYFNQSSVVILLLLWTVWVVSIKLLTLEEVKLLNKFKLPVLLLT